MNTRTPVYHEMVHRAGLEPALARLKGGDSASRVPDAKMVGCRGLEPRPARVRTEYAAARVRSPWS